MANKYSKLVMNEAQIQDWIQFWCEENLSDAFTISRNDIAQRIQYTINSNSDTIKLDFIKCKGGALTIYPNVGSHVDISTQIADSICERVTENIVASPFAHGFSIPLSECDFSAIIDLLNGHSNITQENYSEQLKSGQAKYKLYHFVGPNGDRVALKYYLSTNRMQLQGKPLWLFNEIVAMVSDCETNKNAVVDAHLRYCNLGVSRDDIFDEMENVLGSDVFNFLSTTQKAILATSFILDKIEFDMPDYSGLITPALRAYEGFAKKVFTNSGLNCNDGKQLGSFFNRASDGKPLEMKSDYSCKLNYDTEKHLTSMYYFYYQKRHPYSHASAYDFSTSIIANRKTAEEIFHEIISKIKSDYYCLH